MDFKERRFSIDPGKGKKMDGCPYSIYEDGRDVKDYIIPPKGYYFKGFRFDPDASNQIYDGKLIAEYEKESFNDVVKSNLWKVLLIVVIVAAIAVVVFLALGVFKSPKSTRTTKDPKPEVVAVDTLTKTDSIVSPTTEVTKEDSTTTQTEGTTIEQEEETPTATVDETNQQDEPKSDAEDPNTQFKKDFWDLIHQRTILMDPYDILYKNNKDKASGEEYEYLKQTILRDSPHFKEWTGKLRKIPVTELQRINTIADLKSKIKEIE